MKSKRSNKSTQTDQVTIKTMGKPYSIGENTGSKTNRWQNICAHCRGQGFEQKMRQFHVDVGSVDLLNGEIGSMVGLAQGWPKSCNAMFVSSLSRREHPEIIFQGSASREAMSLFMSQMLSADRCAVTPRSLHILLWIKLGKGGCFCFCSHTLLALVECHISGGAIRHTSKQFGSLTQ